MDVDLAVATDVVFQDFKVFRVFLEMGYFVWEICEKTSGVLFEHGVCT